MVKKSKNVKKKEEKPVEKVKENETPEEDKRPFETGNPSTDQG